MRKISQNIIIVIQAYSDERLYYFLDNYKADFLG